MGIGHRTKDEITFDYLIFGHDLHLRSLIGPKFQRSLKQVGQPSKDIFCLLVGQVCDIGKHPERRNICKIPVLKLSDITDKRRSVCRYPCRGLWFLRESQRRGEIIGRPHRDIPDVRTGVPSGNSRNQLIEGTVSADRRHTVKMSFRHFCLFTGVPA